MTKSTSNRIFSFVVIFALIAAMALSFAGCAKEEIKSAGTVTITVEVVDDEGKSIEYKITTEEATLWGALQQEKLAEGDEGEFGVYIKTVCGIRADYDLDGAYWGLFKDGEYLMTGAESTPILDGEHYELVYTEA